MKKLLSIFLLLFSFFFFLAIPNIIKPASAQAPPDCTNNSATVTPGGNITLIYHNIDIGKNDATAVINPKSPLSGPAIPLIGTVDWVNTNFTVPGNTATGPYDVVIVVVDKSNNANVGYVPCGPVTVTSGGVGVGGLGIITQPPTIPSVGGNPTIFLAGLIRGIISLLIIVAFIADLLWVIFAGFRFVTAGGDPKTVSSAWSQIYWGILGMVIVMGSYAIVRLVEVFFNVCVISCFQLPSF